MPEDIDDTISSKQLQHIQHIAGIASALRDITSDPFKKVMEEKLQRLIVENIETPFYKPDQNLKSRLHKDEDVLIYEKISPRDIYMLGIINGELEIIENRDGEIVYRKIRLSSDKLS